MRGLVCSVGGGDHGREAAHVLTQEVGEGGDFLESLLIDRSLHTAILIVSYCNHCCLDPSCPLFTYQGATLISL